jgi:hypothetical protein
LTGADWLSGASPREMAGEEDTRVALTRVAEANATIFNNVSAPD